MDYIFETTDSLDERIATLAARAKDAREEADEAHKLPGLDGPAQAAEGDARDLEAELADLRQVQKRIERGYPYWDRFGFETAVEACGDAWNCHVLSEIVTPEYVFGHGGFDVRLPLDAEEAYRHAVDSGLFARFEIYATFETEGDAVLAARYYLFGSSDFETMSAVLFHIADW